MARAPRRCGFCQGHGHDRRSCPQRVWCDCPYDPRSPVTHLDGCDLAAYPWRLECCGKMLYGPADEMCDCSEP